MKRVSRVCLVAVPLACAVAASACNGILGTIDLDYGADGGIAADGAAIAAGDATVGAGDDGSMIVSHDGGDELLDGPSEGRVDGAADGGAADASSSDAAADADASDAAYVLPCPFDGGCPCTTAACAPTVVATYPYIDDVAMDSANVYVAADDDGLFRVPRNGDAGATTKIFTPTNQAVTSVTVTSSGLGFVQVNDDSETPSICTISTDGTNAKTLRMLPEQVPTERGELGSTAGRIFWLASESVGSSQLDGGSPLTLAVGAPTSIAFSPGEVYVGGYDGVDSNTGIVRFLAGSATPASWIGPSNQAGGLVSADDAMVYFTDPFANTIYNAPLDFATGTATLIATSPQLSSRVFPASDGFLYWGTGNGTIVRCAKPSCAGGTQVLVNTTASPGWVSVDGTDVYYLDDSPDDEDSQSIFHFSLK